MPSAPAAVSTQTLQLKDARVAVVGLAKSGLAAIELLRRRGAQVVAVDAKSEAELGATAQALRGKGVELAVGGDGSDVFSRVALIVVSPGVPLSSPSLKRAGEAGVPVMGEVELAWRCLTRKDRCLGVTGTNGKSTTTALLGQLLEQGGGKVFTGGNLGRPFSEAALEEQGFDAYAVELSSFQLEGIRDARFQGAAILNLTPDHIDRYESHQAYGLAKARIFQSQQTGDFAVVNADDATVVELAKAARVPVYGFTLSDARPKTFAGLAHPSGEGFAFDFGARETFRVKSRALRGVHNLQNAMAAALLARLSGTAAAAIQTGLDVFPGLPHRLEWVRTLRGVEWINDSKATNVDSSVMAMNALSGNIWLVAGGKGKGAPYAPLVDAARGKLKGVLTIGQDAPTIEAAFRHATSVHPCETLDSAVKQAAQWAKDGDVVLLSPACASYDQFKNFEDRGDRFKQLVKELA